MPRRDLSGLGRALPRLARGALVASLAAVLVGVLPAHTTTSTTTAGQPGAVGRSAAPTSTTAPAPTPATPTASPATAPATRPGCRQAAYTTQDGRTWYWCLPPRDDHQQGASVNGWPPDPDLQTRDVPGTTARLVVRRGPAGDLLLAFALRYDRLVEGITGQPGTDPDDWGYHDRKVRGETHAVSSHASGTAIDLNALCHGLGTDPASTFTPAELGALRDLLAATGGVIGWGGDDSWSARYDPMHFELAPGTTDAQARAALAALGGPAPPALLAAPSRPTCTP